jgi:glycosyltransferase involved in cell wall biosynthesis
MPQPATTIVRIDMALQQRKTIAYVGPFQFPDGGAGARRVLGVSMSLMDSGYDVIMGSGQRSSDNKLRISRLSITSLNELPDNQATLFKKVIRQLTWGGNTIAWLEGLSDRPDVIILAGGYTAYSKRLLPFCHHYKIPLIVDVVEWFQPSHLPGGFWGPFHLNVELAMRWYYVRARNIIPISHYLENYYCHKGCQTIRIPPTLDVQTTAARLDVNSCVEPLILAYTGVPGKKDLLNNVVEALLQVDPEGHRVHLVVAGPKPEELLRFPVLRRFRSSSLPSCVKALGHLTHEEALNVVREADFSVLLRPRLRYAQAGFPTKVPESLAVGTPVMCNITSDLGDYIHDGREGLICRNESVAACMETIERAIRLKSDQKESMRRAARSQAERSFDFRNYSILLDRFIQEARLP